MKRKILLPTDFSKNSIQAIHYALELYKNEHCDFYVLNVFSATANLMKSLMNMEPGSEMYETAKLDSQEGLAKVLDIIAYRGEKNPKHHFETLSRFNSSLEAIKNVVEEKDIEMIVMGSKGKTGDRKIVFGGTSLYVMEKVRNCPVIVVPENAKHELPKEIVFPTGYKMNYKRRELAYLTDIAERCNANIAILHVSKENELDYNQEEHKAMLEEIFENVPHTYHHLPNYSIDVAVNIFVESRDSDMVAFINRKHAFFSSILTQPLVKELSYSSRVPILVMHDLRN